MYASYICNKKYQFLLWHIYTFPLFYGKFASEKAEILFTKFAEIVILEL